MHQLEVHTVLSSTYLACTWGKKYILRLGTYLRQKVLTCTEQYMVVQYYSMVIRTDSVPVLTEYVTVTVTVHYSRCCFSPDQILVSTL
jgi:hypothetical protein